MTSDGSLADCEGDDSRPSVVAIFSFEQQLSVEPASQIAIVVVPVTSGVSPSNSHDRDQIVGLLQQIRPPQAPVRRRDSD